MRHNICRIAGSSTPREFTLSFNPRREICNSCGQLDFDRFYVCEKPPKKNVEKTA